MSSGLRVGIAFVSIAWIAGCGSEPTRLNVLLLVVDTLRADHLPVYGYARPTSPQLDHFAARSIVIDAVAAPSSWTLPSVASMLTSTYPSVHGLRAREGAESSLRLREGLATLAETLRAAGYRTGAVSVNPWVNTEQHGLQRGFETYTSLHQERASVVNEKAREWLQSEDPRPWLLYLHYMDVHGPYAGRGDPTIPDLGAIERRYDRPLSEAQRSILPGYLLLEDETGLSGVVDAYDRGIWSWDRDFGRLLRWLERSGRLARTIVVVVSDHGEEFLEHGGWNHGMTVFEEQIHVPWILRAPGERPRRIEGPASLVDLAPTLLSLLSLPTPAVMQGRNVLARPAHGAARVAFSETHIGRGARLREDGTSLLAMRREDRKWIVVIGDPGSNACFDLARDPHEAEPSRCDRAGPLEARAWAEAARERGKALGENERFELTAERRRRLEELGYAE